MPCYVFCDGETFVTSRVPLLIVNRETFKPIKTLQSLESSRVSEMRSNSDVEKDRERYTVKLLTVGMAVTSEGCQLLGNCDRVTHEKGLGM